MKKAVTWLVASLLSVGLLAGCSSSTPSQSKPADSKSAATQPAAPAAGPTLSRIKKDGVLKVGLEGTYAPFNFIDKNNQMAGFDVDISKEIAKRMGVKVDFVGSEWKSLIGGLQADKFDAIIAEMSITDERKQAVDFTDPYVITGSVLITRQGETDKFKKLDDLKGAKVGVGIGTSFEKLAKSVPGADVKSYDSFEQYSAELINKRVDVIINDMLMMGYTIKNKTLPLEISSPVLQKDTIGIAVKKGNEDFVKQLNDTLKAMIADGTYKTIFKSWFGVDPQLN